MVFVDSGEGAFAPVPFAHIIGLAAGLLTLPFQKASLPSIAG